VLERPGAAALLRRQRRGHGAHDAPAQAP
jgi:hypothetical protein